MTVSAKPQRVVIADDSKMARTVIRRCLEIAGGRDWEFVEAGDGACALKEHLRAGDLLVTDLNMPNMHGLELVRRVRASPRLADIRIIVVSSAADAEVTKSLVALGAKVLMKPVSPALLAEALAALDEEVPS
jgi:two-component system, chemotaxis family, chemotaxis protein CheY